MLNEISAAIARVTREHVDITQLQNSTSLIADFGLNSITRMKLILELEDTLNVEIDLQNIHLSDFDNLGQLIKYIENNSKKTSC